MSLLFTGNQCFSNVNYCRIMYIYLFIIRIKITVKMKRVMQNFAVRISVVDLSRSTRKITAHQFLTDNSLPAARLEKTLSFHFPTLLKCVDWFFIATRNKSFNRNIKSPGGPRVGQA